MEKARVLIVEDDLQFGLIVKNLLELEGIETEIARTRVEALDTLLFNPFDVMLLDLMLGKDSGLSVLKELTQSGSSLPVIIMTAHGSMSSVSEAMQLNAFDYITKPFKKQEIVEIIRRAVKTGRQKEKGTGKDTTGKTLPIIGQSAMMVEVYKAIARVSQTDSTVLISGESGTGKELVARAIHDNSARAKNAFVAVNCGALTETLLESELFGHAKGAFTGANTAHHGIFESATGGTVFLDEISETSPAFQVKLLRVLQQRTIRPVGGAEERSIDVRILAATNRPVESLLNSSFRKDLLYRLSVINIHIPPLRERAEDVPLLAKHFLHRFNRRQKKSVVIPANTMAWMQTLPWHGNVREVENAIERAVTMNASGEILPDDLRQFGPLSTISEPAPDATPVSQVPALPAIEPVGPAIRKEIDEEPPSLDELTRDHIVKVLKYTGGNKLRAAEILGVGRWSLYRMGERLGINLHELTYEKKPRRRKGKRSTEAELPDGLSRQEFFDSLNDIVYTRDWEGTITSINSAGERYFGHPRDGLIGRSLHDLFNDKELLTNLKATNERLIREGSDRSIVSIQEKSGLLRMWEFNVSLIKGNTGTPIGARGIMRDVTEAKELEAQLRKRTIELQEANEKLQEINRIKADFTAMLVHDLKTPAATMLMALEYLTEKLSPGHDLREMIQAGLTAGSNMIQIIADMLEVFRFDSSEIQLARTPMTAEEMILDPYQEALMQARMKNIELTKQIAAGLPLLNADKLRMHRVLSNLLGNALKFTPAGGKIHITVQKSQGAGLEQENSFVQISVLDSGEGIPAEHLAYIFDPYRQASQKELGTGLGLAIVKRIVSAHGGTVSVRSRVGVGSEFSIMLPAKG